MFSDNENLARQFRAGRAECRICTSPINGVGCLRVELKILNFGRTGIQPETVKDITYVYNGKKRMISEFAFYDRKYIEETDELVIKMRLFEGGPFLTTVGNTADGQIFACFNKHSEMEIYVQ